MNLICENCRQAITVMCFKGERWCSDLCRKALEKKDASEEEE